MAVFNLQDGDEMEIQLQKRINELEKANQDLRAENIALNRDIAKFKRAEEVLTESEQSVRLKLENDLSPSQKIDSLELADIIDTPSIQSILEDFNKLSHIPIGLNDLKGNVLVGVGWQDICTKFHRVHPEACKHCIESDINLSKDVAPGGYKLYKCKNNMWDIVTPIMVGGQQVGYIFAGQFFFEDEPLDYELFRAQAKQYCFNEEEYIAALEKVPRLSREVVNTGMDFLMAFANMTSQLSYSNIMLAQSLVERDTLVDALRKRSAELEAVLDAVPASVYIAHDPQALHITGNRLSYEWLQLPEGTNLSKSAPPGEKPEFFKLFKDGREIPSEKMPLQMAASGKKVNDCELDIISSDGDIRHVLGNARPLRDEQGNICGSVSAFIDITERNRADKALKKMHDNLEKIVEERTEELEKAYNSLKESEESLAEAQKMAHVGHWQWTIATEKSYWSEELYSIFGRDPHEPYPTYQEFLNYVLPDDRDYVNNAANRAMNGKAYSINYRIIRANGEERTVHMQSQIIFDENKIPVQIKGIVQDITEKKEAEKAFLNIAAARKKEIHHRIKNNLQVISSLLNLQAEKFKNRDYVNDSEVLEAFRESQDRIVSIALIHEELYEGEGADNLNFSLYLEKLVENLLNTYRFGNINIELNLDLRENIFFDMDTAVPLGMVVNEVITNSLKYAFPDIDKGAIQVKLFSEEARKDLDRKKELVEKTTSYTLIVSDNGIGIPEEIDFENSDTLGLQLVNILVEQLDGEIELKRHNGTEFIIKFSVKEKENL